MLGRIVPMPALYTLLLFVILLVSRTVALPYVANEDDGKANMEPDCPEIKRPELANEVYQIADGQPQVSYTVIIEEILLTSESSSMVSSSTATSFYTYTPLARQFTSFTTSITTATAFVTTEVTGTVQGTSVSVEVDSTPSTRTGSATSTNNINTDTVAPVPSTPESFPAVTTSIPDGALTSLTTSEVQTVTAPPPTHTSGVSEMTV